ncbi:MAG: hypothetical protein GEV03_14280 [Streptosporangiales bacterium]|nr:hypothetical protein [Streptosporangiales bacterium]
MTRMPPTNLRSLETRLRNLARAQAVPERRLRRLVGIVILGQLLARTGAAAIKGASNIEVRVGTRGTRVSSDLDTVRSVSIDRFQDEFAAALRAGWAGFTGLLVDDGEIDTREPGGYRPHRYRAKLEYVGRPFGTITVEVAPEEVDALTNLETIAVHDAADWFDELGLPAPQPVPALPLTHQIAQKLHACTTPDDDTWINDRAHDLVDLQLAARVYPGPMAEIREVAVRLFAARNTHVWPPLVTARTGWQTRYTAEADGLDVLPTLDDAIAWVNDFIAQIEVSAPH